MTWRKGTRRLLDGLILALVVWLLGAAAYVSLGRLLVPVVADYREELLVQAEAAFERAIAVESLSGEMQGAQPVIFLKGLRVHASPDPASPTLFQLDNVTGRLDLFASLWRRQPVLDALQIEGLALEVVEEVDGRWTLQGLGATGQLQPDVDRVLDALGNMRRITLLESEIRIRPQDMPDWEFTRGDLTLINRGRRHRLDARVILPSGEELAMRVTLQRHEVWQDSAVEFFADLPALQWSQWLPSEWLERLSINQLVAGGRYWGRVDGGRLERLRAELHAPLLKLQTEREPQSIEDLSAQLEVELAGERIALRVDELEWRLGAQQWAPSRLQGELHTDGTGAWQLAADAVPLEWLGRLLPDHLGDAPLAEILSRLDLRGTLRDLHLTSSSRQAGLAGLYFGARLDGVGVEPWQAVPGFNNLSGTLEGTPSQGSLRLASRDWSMQLPRLFEHVWHYHSLQGELGWKWSAERGLQLEAPGLRVEGEQGRGAVSLTLNLPAPEQIATMDLKVALRDSAATYHELYLPTRAPAFSEALSDWLASSELSGRVPLAIFSYSGSIEREVMPEDRALDLYATLEDGHLRFLPDWPALEGVQGTLRLHNQDMLVEHARARLWNTELEEVRLTVDRAAPGQPLRLDLAGKHRGPLADGLRIAQETPVAEMTGQFLADWRGEGNLSGELSLQLPLQPAPVPALEMAWQVDARELWIPQLQAPLNQVRGQLAYRHGDGLQADGVTLGFLGQPVRLDIRRDQGAQSIDARGSHSVAALSSWPLLERLPLDVAQGALDWRAELLLDRGHWELAVRSNLEQLSLDLPGPLAKPAGESWSSELKLELEEGEQHWSLEMGDALRGVARVTGETLRAEVRYRDGMPRRLPSSGLAVGARLAHLDISTWQDWIERRFPDGPGEGGAAPALAGLQRVELQAERFTGMGRELADLDIGAERLSRGWQIRVEQADIAGTLLLPDDDQAPMLVDLARLRFERPPQAEQSDALVEPVVPRDPLEAVRPSRLPAMDVRVAEIIWGEDRVAEGSFTLRPYAGGALLSDVQASLRGGLHVAGQIDWREAAGRSQFNGTLEADDVGKVLRAWQYAPTLTSNEFSAAVDLTWPGSPAFFALKRGTGDLQLRARDGVVQSGEGSAEALRIFGLLNFNALTRRLRLDFSDIFGRGTAYDRLDTQLTLADGVIQTRAPLVLDGPSARIELDGLIDLPRDSIDMGMLVTLPLTNNLPLAAILVGAPYLGGALFIADRILGDRISRIASVKYRVSGDWQQPTVEFDRAFDNKAALEE